MNTPQGMVKYRYDDGGNRIEKIKGGVTERYIRDHTGREMALHSSTEGYKYFNLFGNGSIGRVDVGSRDAIWIDPETNEEIMVKLRVDNRRYYVQDHLGSNRVTIDTTGTVLNAQDYYAFGEILRSYNNSSPNERYDFTGKERDTESGLNYHGARYYDSELGRWLNVDPLADKYPGVTPYHYCSNNPLNRVDPNGMEDNPIEKIQQDGRNIDNYMTSVLGTDALSASGNENTQELKENGEKGLNNRDATITEGGLILSEMEYSLKQGNAWRGKNGKWFFGGANGATGSKTMILKQAKIFRSLGKGLFVISVIVTAVDIAGTDNKSEIEAKSLKGGTDVVISTIGTFGGPAGAIFAGGYFLLDFAHQTGLIGDKDIKPIPQPFGVPDKTKVKKD